MLAFRPVVYRNIAIVAAPISTSPTRRQIDGFFLFRASTSLSCDTITASLAAIVSFLASTTVSRAATSPFLVSFTSLSTALAVFSVVRRSNRARSRFPYLKRETLSSQVPQRWPYKRLSAQQHLQIQTAEDSNPGLVLLCEDFPHVLILGLSQLGPTRGRRRF